MFSKSATIPVDDALRTADLHPKIRLIRLHDLKHNVSEIEISIPYGKLTGRWFGPKDLKPILCLHGWLDNSGTFDRLIPLLPEDLSYLAIDFPGHGHSSRIPDGMAYHITDSIILLLHIMKEYGWDKVALMGHSMGAIIGFMFSALFPEKVDFLIGIDGLKPQSYYAETVIPHIFMCSTKCIEADIRNREQSEPPVYAYEEMVEKLHQGTFQSVSVEACPYMLQRNIQPSRKFPEKYYFDRDIKLKYSNIPGWSDSVNHELAKRINVPYLVVRALESQYPDSGMGFDAMVKILKEYNPHFTVNYLHGMHHIHLTDPERVAPIVTAFLKEYCIKHADRAPSKITSKL